MLCLWIKYLFEYLKKYLLREGFAVKKQILPFLNLAKGGFVSKIPVYKIFNYILQKLYTGCTWSSLSLDYQDSKKISCESIYYHFRKWSNHHHFEKIVENLIKENRHIYDLSALHLDGRHTIAKKGGSKVNYNRKKMKTNTCLFVTDAQGLHFI